MKWAFFRRSSSGATAGSSRVSGQALVAEFLVVVAGILVALGVDDWRQDRQELAISSEHLAHVAVEVGQNLESVERVQGVLDAKRRGLEVALRFLDDPNAADTDPETVLRAFAASALTPVPWLRDNQFQALQNSGELRLLRDPELTDLLADNYAMAGVLFAQVDRIRNSYPAVVQQLLPAGTQPRANPLSWYVPESVEAPAVADDDTYVAALERIRARSAEILPLARGEAAVYTAEWYVLERMRRQLKVLVGRLPVVDIPQTRELVLPGQD